MLPTSTLFRAFAFIIIYFMLRISMGAQMSAFGQYRYVKSDINPAIWIVALILFCTFTVLRITRLADLSHDFLYLDLPSRVGKPARQYVSFTCICAWLFSSRTCIDILDAKRSMRMLASFMFVIFFLTILLEAIIPMAWSFDISNVIAVYFCQYIMIDLGFCLFTLGAASTPHGDIGILLRFVLTFIASFSAVILTFLAVLSITLTSAPTACVLLPVLAAFLVEFIHRKVFVVSSKAFWIFRLALYFVLLVNLMFVFVPIGPNTFYK